MGNGGNGSLGSQARGTTDRGAGAAARGTGYRPEENLPGGIDEPRAGEQFHVIGFDIADTRLTPIMKKDLDRIAVYLRQRDDVDYQVVVTGTASESKIQRLDPYALGLARAEAVRNYLLNPGRIPAERIFTFSHGSTSAPPASSSPEVKAEWRGAFIDIRFSGSSRRPAPKPKVPVPTPDPNKDLTNIKILKPPLTYKEIPKKVKEIAKFIQSLNQSASSRVFHDAFGHGWAHGLALLTEADPAARSLDTFARLPQADVASLTTMRLQANADPKGSAIILDRVRAAGMRLAFDQIRALGPEAYEAYAAGQRARLPDLNARERLYFDRALHDQWEI